MKSIHEKVLVGIYDEFEAWLDEDLACRKGCATCCTQNVVISAMEGELIYGFIKGQGLDEWFVESFQDKAQTTRLQQTTNSFAASCLRGEDVVPESPGPGAPCPFLDGGLCAIYEVRPFSCRCFVSTKTCRSGRPASIDESYLAAATAVMQIIEHLGQGQWIGNMLDILPALSSLAEYRHSWDIFPQSLVAQGLAKVVQASPLPGFLLLEEEMDKVGPLLEAIFARKVGQNCIEDILNKRVA